MNAIAQAHYRRMSGVAQRLAKLVPIERRFTDEPFAQFRREDDARARRIAAIRNGTPRASTNHWESCDPLYGNYMGVRGEILFSRIFNLPVDEELRPEGDGGSDFNTVINGHPVTIDVKTARKAFNLLVEEKNRRYADIYVLAFFDKNDDEDDANARVELLGWELPWLVLLSTPREFQPGSGVPDFYQPCDLLRPMPELRRHLEWVRR